MKIIKNLRIKTLLKNWVFWLIIITTIAVILRSLPGWVNEAWGCDFGIYYGITKTVIETKAVFPPYTGWGGSYNEFPMLYLVNAFAAWITGIDIQVIMPKITPIFGGFSILIFYFFLHELIKDKKIALLSSLFLAVLPFHVYQTSHASPLTMGHFFMILSMYFFLKYRKNTKYIIPLLISTMLLIMSHHLTTYFYIIILIFIVFIENIKNKNWTVTLKKDLYYILTSSVMIFSYWGLIATTVYNNFMGSGISIGVIRLKGFHVIILFYVIFFAMLWFIKMIKKHQNFIENAKFLIKKNFMSFITIIKTINQMPKNKGNVKKIGKIMWFKSKNQSNYLIMKFSITLLCFLFFMIFFSIVKIPWTNFTFTVETIFYSFPLIITISLAVVGFGYVFRQKKDFFICGWFLAVLASLFYALITNNNILFPDRHIEYLMAPIAFFAVYGLGGIFSDPDYKIIPFFSPIKKARSLVKSFSLRKNYSTVRIAFLFVIIFLVFSLASTVYISYSSLNVAVEEISKENYQAIIWMSENLDKNSSIIASDHRIARLAESYGFNTTKDETINLWDAENLDQYIDELIGIGQNHSSITHIIIDDKMKNDVVHVYFGIIKYMTNETSIAAYDKFKQLPFELVYRNESIEIDSKTNESLRWTEVYKVNWSYIEENYLPTIKDKI